MRERIGPPLAMMRPPYFLAAFLLRLAFSAAPALKRAFFEAGILISLPVAGLRPLPAARSRTEKVPKPTRRTSSPFLSDLPIPSSIASSALAARHLRQFGFPWRRADEFKLIHPTLRFEQPWQPRPFLTALFVRRTHLRPSQSELRALRKAFLAPNRRPSWPHCSYFAWDAQGFAAA